MRRYATHHGEVTRVLGVSILVQVIRVLQGWCLGCALGLQLPLLTYFVFIPIIVLIMQIPITVSGLGTTQLAFDRLFIPQGAAPPQVFVFSILFLALGIIGTLPGGVLYALGADSLGRRSGVSREGGPPHATRISQFRKSSHTPRQKGCVSVRNTRPAPYPSAETAAISALM